MRNVIKNLGIIGVGVKWGIIDVIAMQMTKPRLEIASRKVEGEVEAKKKKRYATTERQTIEEIYEVVDGSIHLTFGELPEDALLYVTFHLFRLPRFHGSGGYDFWSRPSYQQLGDCCRKYAGVSTDGTNSWDHIRVSLITNQT